MPCPACGQMRELLPVPGFVLGPCACGSEETDLALLLLSTGWHLRKHPDFETARGQVRNSYVWPGTPITQPQVWARWPLS